ncbi:MAG: hypothetical protein J7598_00745 [Mitsuaria chitosanitabida]|uniref:nuclear transport factor 2 family protein n=1 Tax=Roseateles chitosanitabidus TaxID=65048 RepID=UPI001B271913|nr:hypothetical protein [Roseateles chitosanitabidus]MBO9685112.1 hypothetical protein [Roseateles chitosanitabidus]
MTTNLDIIRATYEGPSEENGKNLLAVLTPDATWTETAGFPYAGTYRKTGKAMTATFAHLYQLKEGRILSMEQYVDSHRVQQALLAD